MAGEDNGIRKKEQDAKLFLRPSSIVTIVFLTITAIALAYVAGVMSGRHGSGARETTLQEKSQPQETSLNGEEREKILAPEELNFVRELRGQPARKSESQVPVLPEMESLSETEGDVNAVTERDVSVPAASSAQSSAMFDYLFQMAAFRDENSADNLRQKLEGAGYRTILQRNGKLLVVLVRIRGSEGREEELRKFALSLKLGEPLLKNKQVVSH